VESLGELDGSLVALDTAPIIYFIEKYQPWVRSVKPLFGALDNDRFRAVTSSLTLAEVLVHPFRNQRADLAAEYRQLLLGARNLRTIPVGPAIAERAAELRSRFSFRTPDAIQIATAIQAGAEWFITNDKKLRVPGSLQFVLVDELPALPLFT